MFSYKVISFCTQLRNASRARCNYTDVFYTKVIEQLLEVFMQKGLIVKFIVLQKGLIRVFLKYYGSIGLLENLYPGGGMMPDRAKNRILLTLSLKSIVKMRGRGIKGVGLTKFGMFEYNDLVFYYKKGASFSVRPLVYYF